MTSSQADNTTRAEIGENQEVVNAFIDSYWKSNIEVDTYKQRKAFKKWGSRVAFSLLIIGMIASVIMGSGSNSELSQLLIYAIVFLAFLSMAISGILDILLMRSDLDNEVVACHELAKAFQSYIDSNGADEESIEYHLQEAKSYLKTPGILSPVNAVRISNSHREGIHQYINNYLNATDREEELENSFPEFMALVAGVTALSDESQIEKLSRKVTTGPSQSPSVRDGIRRELSRLKSSVVNARVGIVIVGIVVAILSYPHIGIGGGFGLGAFVVTAYGVLQG